MKRIFLFVIACIGFTATVLYFYTRPPMVSVVMPVYNRQDLVGRAIDSILNQTYKNFEFIIVDDGSTDGTPAILQAYAHQDSRIKLLTNPENKGISYSRQRGLDAAKGKYVAIMDSDDWSVPSRLEKSLAFMRDYPDIDAMSGVVLPLSDDTVQKIKPTDSSYSFAKGPDFYAIELSFFNTFANVASLFKRDFAIQNHIRYNLDLISAEDYDFWAQMVLAGGKLASVANTLTYFRKHYSNTPDYYNRMFDTALEVHRKLLSRFFEPNPTEVKFSYSMIEKCFLLNKMREANRAHPKISQEALDSHYTNLCPLDLNKTLYLTHPNWSDFIEVLDNNRIKRMYSGDMGTLTRNGDQITIAWDIWDTESFEKQTDNSYKYISDADPSDLTVFNIKHPQWHDQLILNAKTQKACRRDAFFDCATLTSVSKDIIRVQWDNPDYPVEEFKKDEQENWKLIKSLTQGTNTQFRVSPSQKQENKNE